MGPSDRSWKEKITRRYRIDGIEFAEDAPEMANALADTFARKLRPLCLCRPDGVPMYIARFDGQHLVKRMPSSGGSHDPSCAAYQPPHELSGLGPLIGDAIRIDEENGVAALRLDFSLAKTGARSAPAVEASASDTVKNISKRLSLRALLHYLWQEGELTEWTAAWAGKRGWGRVRTSLMEAAQRMTVSSGSLSEVLFVPEVFHPEDKSAIAARRATTLAVLAKSGTGKRKLMVLVGEVKEFAEARSGRRLIVKHMPDYPLVIEEWKWKRLETTFATEFAFWNADPALHLVTILTFGPNAAGLVVIEEMALMITTENWIPFETAHERQLLERLARLRRKSVKGLRFNLSPDKPVVSVTLPEPRPDPVAMFILPADADEAYEVALAGMIEARPEMRAWIWHVGEGDIPKLPWGHPRFKLSVERPALHFKLVGNALQISRACRPGQMSLFLRLFVFPECCSPSAHRRVAMVASRALVSSQMARARRLAMLRYICYMEAMIYQN